MKTKKYIPYHLFLLVPLSSFASDYPENELVRTQYNIVDYEKCSYIFENKIQRISFYGYPNYKGDITTDKEVKYPNNEYKGMPSVDLSYNGYSDSDWFLGYAKYKNYKGEHCQKNETIIYPENHRPNADFHIEVDRTHSSGVSMVTVYSTSSDLDEGTGLRLVKGQITEHIWKVNGIEQKSKSRVISFPALKTGNYTIELTVKDHGVKYAHPSRDMWLNDGETFFKLQNSTTQTHFVESFDCKWCVID